MLLRLANATGHAAHCCENFSAKRNGIDISYIGVSIGSSDMNAQPYTYD
jgi:hypothetical protein